jgi:hypothetical protein
MHQPRLQCAPLLALACIVLAHTLLAAPAHAQPSMPALQAKAVMTDSSVAPLAGNKRVAIGSVVLSFQTSMGEKTSTNGMFGNKSDASVALQMPEIDGALVTGIAEEIALQLRTDLSAAGFEVVPEAEVLASPAYRKVVKMAGISNLSKFVNWHGDILLVGPAALTPYLPYAVEAGKFATPGKSLIKGWVSGFVVTSSTPGGPTGTSTGELYELPAAEVALAKELNAHVLKATYVITLGATKVDTSHAENRTASTASARAQVGLLPGQTRIALRTSAANPKGESASRDYAANFGLDAAPAKDGDVVVALGEPLLGGSSHFATDAPPVKTGTLLGGLLSGFGSGADKQFTYTASVADAPAYRADVLRLLKAAQRDLLAAVKP